MIEKILNLVLRQDFVSPNGIKVKGLTIRDVAKDAKYLTTRHVHYIFNDCGCADPLARAALIELCAHIGIYRSLPDLAGRSNSYIKSAKSSAIDEIRNLMNNKSWDDIILVARNAQ